MNSEKTETLPVNVENEGLKGLIPVGRDSGWHLNGSSYLLLLLTLVSKSKLQTIKFSFSF